MSAGFGGTAVKVGAAVVVVVVGGVVGADALAKRFPAGFAASAPTVVADLPKRSPPDGLLVSAGAVDAKRLGLSVEGALKVDEF